MMIEVKRYMVFSVIRYDWEDDTKIEDVEFYDDWLDAVKHNPHFIIDLETGRAYDYDHPDARKTELDFAWYMIDD